MDGEKYLSGILTAIFVCLVILVFKVTFGSFEVTMANDVDYSNTLDVRVVDWSARDTVDVDVTDTVNVDVYEWSAGELDVSVTDTLDVNVNGWSAGDLDVDIDSWDIIGDIGVSVNSWSAGEIDVDVR